MTLRERRESLGLTQEQMAVEAEMHQAEISAFERGMVPNPGINRLERLATAYQWSLTETIAALRETVEVA